MFRSLRKTMTTIGATLLLSFVPAVALPVAAYAAADIGQCLGQGSDLSTAGGGDSCTGGDTAGGAERIQTIVTTIVNIFSIIVGIVAVVMIIYGGFKYITSGGDSGKITSAKSTVVYALIGLVIAALAQTLAKYVLANL